jgi:AraC-like DNA-binding protein
MKEPRLDPGLHVHAPSAKLAGFISHYWLGVDNRDRSYDIVPDGCIDVVLHEGGAKVAVWAYGTTTRIKREAIAPGNYLGVRFRPGMARFFLDIPARELTDTREPAPRNLAHAIDALSDFLGTSSAFSRLDRALERHLACFAPRTTAIDAATRTIAACHGGVRIEDLVRGYGKSRRQFEREFLECVGITAKHFGVIARFRHAAARLTVQPERSLAAIAADAGYADQSHMVRDFQRLGGASPSRWAGHVAFVQDSQTIPSDTGCRHQQPGE